MPKKVKIIENDIEPPEETREEIVEQVEDPAREITLDTAQKNDKKNTGLKVGDKIYAELPQTDFGRIADQSAKQVISTRDR